MLDEEFGFEFGIGLEFVSPAESLRYRVNKLETIRNKMLECLESANDDLASIGVELQFNTAIAHPSYEIHLIDDLITKLSAELAIESRKEKLAQSV
ncbi:hypothetical protein [Stenotrophomonas phage RAS14]